MFGLEFGFGLQDSLYVDITTLKFGKRKEGKRKSRWTEGEKERSMMRALIN